MLGQGGIKRSAPGQISTQISYATRRAGLGAVKHLGLVILNYGL